MKCKGILVLKFKAAQNERSKANERNVVIEEDQTRRVSPISTGTGIGISCRDSHRTLFVGDRCIDHRPTAECRGQRAGPRIIAA